MTSAQLRFAMSRVLLLALLVLAAPASAQWVQLNGPLPPSVGGLAAADGVLVLGNDEADAGDVYRSTDGGQTWTNARFPNGGVQLVYAHGGTIYLGTYISGTFRSTDGGQSWQPVPGLPSGFADAYAAMAAVGDTLLLAPGGLGFGPIQRSTDGGSSWTAVGPSDLYRALAVADGVVVATTETHGFYRSTDAGLTWAPANVGLPSGARGGALALHEGALYAGLNTFSPWTLHVLRSDDGGASWTPVGVSFPPSAGYAFLSLTSWQGSLVAGLGATLTGAVYRSTDDGVSWTHFDAGLPPDPRGQVLLPAADALWLGTDQGPFRKASPGEPWAYAGHGTAAISGVASLLAQGDALLVGLTDSGGGGRGLWRTDDLGATWTRLDDGLSDRAAIRALYREGATLFAGDYGVAPRGVYRSDDGGASWTFSSSGIRTDTIINDIHGYEGVLLAGAYEALYRSTDGGHTWATVPAMAATEALASYAGALWAGRDDGHVLRSNDRGLTWSDVSAGLGGSGVNALVVSGGALYAGTWGGGVYRLDLLSPSAGRVPRWTRVGLAGSFVDALVDVRGVLVAASALGGLLFSRDGGVTWTPLDDGYTGGEAYALAATTNRLVVGTRGHALWARPLSIPGFVAPAEAADALAIEAAGRLVLYPNPVAPGRTATLALDVTQGGPVTVSVYDALGRRVGTAAFVLTAGAHRLPLAVPPLAPGLYLVRVEAGESVTTARLTVRP